ncbi:MAG: tail fiber domain-containing protein [Sphingobacteriaceae bacterium]
MLKRVVYILGIFLSHVLFLCHQGYCQNVGINANGNPPDPSAGLDINFTNKGLLIPQVALTSTNTASPVSSPANSLLVYNTASAGSGGTAVTPGYYYWTSSPAAWNKLSVSGPALTTQWTTSGTNIYNNNTGNVGIGTSSFAASPNAEKLLVDAGTGTTTGMNVVGNRNSFFQFNIQNKSTGATASSDIVATSSNGTNTSAYVNMGINGGGYDNSTDNILNGINTTYLYGNGGKMIIGNGARDYPLIFFTNKTTTSTEQANGKEAIRIDANGNVGIGDYEFQSALVTNGAKLVVEGSITPKTNGVGNLGSSSVRWGTVYSTNGSINTSDRRLKKNITDLNYGLNEIVALHPVRYNWKSIEDNSNKIGLIAQDTKKIVPEVVYGDESKEDLGMSYSELVPVLINAIQDLKKQIDVLKQSGKTQQTTIDALLKKLENKGQITARSN